MSDQKRCHASGQFSDGVIAVKQNCFLKRRSYWGVNDLRKIFPVLIALPFVLLTGCGSVPNATVTQSQATFHMPEITDIKSLSIESDFASRITVVPNAPLTTMQQVLTLLKTAQPVDVEFPELKNQISRPSGGYSGPATLDLNLKNNDDIRVTPAYYVWTASQGGYSYHYVNGVVGYRDGDSTIYLRDASLYEWLKEDKWKNAFHVQTN